MIMTLTKIQTMKSTVILLILFGVTNAKGQVAIDTVNRKMYLDQVINMEGTVKELKEKAFVWVAKTYNNSNFVTRVNTDTKIITKGMFEITGVNIFSPPPYKDVENPNYTMELSFKDGKYRLEIKDIDYDGFELAFLTQDEYQQFWIGYWENYEGAGKKFALNKMHKDKYISKAYLQMKEITNPQINQLKEQILFLQNSLLQHMKAKSSNDDW